MIRWTVWRWLASKPAASDLSDDLCCTNWPQIDMKTCVTLRSRSLIVSTNWTLAIVMMACVIQSVPLKQQPSFLLIELWPLQYYDGLRDTVCPSKTYKPLPFWLAVIMTCVKWVIFASSSLLFVLYSLHSWVSTGQHSWPLLEDDAISSSDRPTTSSNKSEMTSSEAKGREEEVKRKSKEDDCLKACRLQLTGRVSIVKKSDHDNTQLIYLFPESWF